MKKYVLILSGCLAGIFLLVSPFESQACKKVKLENADLREQLEDSRSLNAELEVQLREQQRGLEMRNRELTEMQNRIDTKNSELQRLYDEGEP